MVSKSHPDPPSRPSSAGDDAMPEWFVEAEQAEKSGRTETVSTQAPSPRETAESTGAKNGTDPEQSREPAPEDPPVEEIEDLEEAVAELAQKGADPDRNVPTSPDAGQDLAGSGAEEGGGEGDEAAVWKRKAEENREKWMRAMAELENFRKRSRREIENSIIFANANLLRELLDVLDDFERAQNAANEDEEGSKEGFREGIRLIYQRFVEVLRRSGLERIPAKGEDFDPNLHEAISQIETDEVESGKIAHVVQQGYRLNDMVLRPAKVVVAK